MDESDKLQRDTNLRFHALCQQAREWVVETLKAKGCNCRIQDHYVITTAYDEASGEDAQARLAIFPLIGHWNRTAHGIRIKIERERNPIQYRRETEKWQDFPWDKILTDHVEEAQRRLKSRLAYRAEQREREELTRLAKEEVPLPVAEEHIHGEHLSGFDRRRNHNGTYLVEVRCYNMTAAEARSIRDLVLAAENRTRSTPLSIPETKHEDQAQTAASAPSPQQEA
jgi:hypothetical protein